MPLLLKDGTTASDDWQVIEQSHEDIALLPTGKIIVPVATWTAHNTALQQRGDTGVWLNSDEAPELIANDIASLSIIAINFPVFADGRGYSYARLIREKYNFVGELRAIGDVLRDQVYFYKRCGFNSFAIRADHSAEQAASSLSDFSHSYQAAFEPNTPLFKQ